MNLDKIVIVLSRPEESRNIGAVCRGMANNGIHTLRIVGDRNSIDVERVHILQFTQDIFLTELNFLIQLQKQQKTVFVQLLPHGVKEKNAAENYFFPKNLLLWQTLLPEQKLLKAEKSL